MNAPSPAAVQGTFADLKSVKTRSVVQMIIEAPIEQAAEIVRLFGFPQPGKEVPVAVARLRAAPQQIETQPATKRQMGDLAPAQQAGILCSAARFRKFLHETRENAWLLALSQSKDDPVQAAAVAVRAICGVHSRAELASNPQAELAWQDLKREYDIWLTA